jgi:hypothetical protein
MREIAGGKMICHFLMKSDKLVKLPEGMLINFERLDHHKINFTVFSFFSLWFFFQL